MQECSNNIRTCYSFPNIFPNFQFSASCCTLYLFGETVKAEEDALSRFLNSRASCDAKCS